LKICRFNENRIGVVRDGAVRDVSGIIGKLPALTYPLPFGDPFIAALPQLHAEMEALAERAPSIPLADVKFLSPVANPSKIIGTPANYAAHNVETAKDPEIAVYRAAQAPNRSIEEQGLFLKATSSLVGTSEGVAVRFPDRRTDHEVELGVVIGRRTGYVPEADALKVVAGYAIALDMVMRGKEDRSYRKSIDTYAVLGPWLVTADEIANPNDLAFSLRVNGDVRQAANTRDMIIGVAKQISWASSIYDLYPGDIIMSGTCDGVGPVRPGDVMALSFEKIGDANVPVRAA